jgi:hypothetical protein
MNLFGYSSKQQQWSYLTQSITSTDITFTVNDVRQISRGLIEVGGSELMLVKSVNQQTNTVFLEPGGRGAFGSTASAWASSALIENNPIFPFVRIKESVNDAINALYPDLFAVGTSKFPKVSVVFNYPLPADCEEVINVKYQLIGPSNIYPWCRSYRYDNTADTTTFPTGRSINILEDITPGREIQVTYMKEPSLLANPSDDFASVTGLPGSVADLVFYAGMTKMVPALSGPRLILDSVEAAERASFVQPQQIAQVSQYYNTLYQDRLLKESRKLMDRYKRPLHYEES